MHRAGACAADGHSEDSVPVQGVPFEVVQTNGTWSAIHTIGGLPFNAVTWVSSVSCASAGNCAAGGYWLTNDGSIGDCRVSGRHILTSSRS